MNSGLSPTPSAVGVPGVKLKFCRYYAKDKTCFYGDECQFLHEEPLGIHGNSLAAYPPQPVLTPGAKKVELGALEGQRLAPDYGEAYCAAEEEFVRDTHVISGCHGGHAAPTNTGEDHKSQLSRLAETDNPSLPCC